jgi:hypothetical protein
MSHQRPVCIKLEIYHGANVFMLKFILNPDTKRSVPTHLIHRFGSRARALLPNRGDAAPRTREGADVTHIIYKRPQRRRRLICTQDIYDAPASIVAFSIIFEKGRRRRHTYLHLVAEEKTPGGYV